ncbi:MAG: homocitrate synthase [Clostridia bacterium]|nr:homocitrate synthase [Clostridia bacterium]
MEAKIVDTTLRDGEQKAGIAFTVNDKVRIAKLLDTMGVFQIEAGIPAMGIDEMRCVRKILEQNLKSRISTWNRMNPSDIAKSIECAPHIIHISVPSSDIQIKSKLRKDRSWVLSNMKKCISIAVEKGFEVTVGMEDASRADQAFLVEIISAALGEGSRRIRYADTVGVLYWQRAYDEVESLINQTGAEIEIHAHNDFGMAVSNSLAALKAGAEYVDCTVLGIGERAGNCDYLKFIKAARGSMGLFKDLDIEYIEKIHNDVTYMIDGKGDKIQSFLLG